MPAGGAPLIAYGFEQKVRLDAGDNAIRVLIVDAAGQRAERVVHVRATPREGTVYVLAVGVADYQDADVPDLKWTERDAEEFAEFFKTSPTSPAKPENVQVLLGSQSDKRSILLAVADHLERQAVHEEDTVIFFFAGHGGVGTHPVRGTEYFLYPYDAVARSLAVTGLEVSELQRRWSAMRAGTKVFVSDACHSAGVAVRGEEAGAEQVGEGSVSLTAAKASQQSLELPDLQHGLYTWYLLKGLRGEADGVLGVPDGKVAVSELKAFLDREVPAAAARIGGRQTPVTLVEGSGEIYLAR